MKQNDIKTKTMPLRLRKYLQNKSMMMTTVADHEKSNKTFDFKILTNPLLVVDIVYFANLFVNPDYGPQLIRQQLTDLVSTGLTRFSKIHIVLSTPPDFDDVSFQNSMTMLFQKQYRSLEFDIGHDNCHEYPGILRVYSLAKENKHSCHYILYFHSKGITRFHGRRERTELALHKTVIAPWKRVLEIFATHPHIDKIGSTASTGGWIWWNYWWVRASYLVRVEKPVKTDRRHYYEDWLCRVLIRSPEQQHVRNRDNHNEEEEYCFQEGLYDHDVSNCWSLSSEEEPIGNGYEPQDAHRLLSEGLRLR